MITETSGLDFRIEDGVAILCFARPERKNALTFDIYHALHARFTALASERQVRAILLTGAGDNFCSGGDVHEIIGPLTRFSAVEQLEFTRLTASVTAAMLACPQPIIAAVDGVAAGAGAALAMAADLRLGTPRSRALFLFNRVGLSACDMGATFLLPRLIGQGRAAELLFTGRPLGGEEAMLWGFFNSLHDPAELFEAAMVLARSIASGPGFATSLSKSMLLRHSGIEATNALEAEAQAQALCMQTADFRAAFRAFADKTSLRFEGR